MDWYCYRCNHYDFLMILFPFYYGLKLVISIITFPLTLFEFALPTPFQDSIVYVMSKVFVFQGVFPVVDLFIALGVLLTTYIVMLVVRVIFMGLNAIPGVHIKSPRESYISSASVHTADNGTVFITTDKKHISRNDRY